MLSFDANTARQADQISSALSEPGKYIGTITRAEKLLSSSNTQGLGLSFKSDSGESADYLDLYTINSSGVVLPSMKVVQALLGCLQLRTANDGKIKIEKWNKESKKREETVVDGYPDIQNKRIGLLLQKEISTNTKNGETVERLIIVGVFQPDTLLTVSEILAKKTQPEALEKMISWLAANPIRDTRKNKTAKPANDDYGHGQPANTGTDPLGQDDIPF